MPRTYRTAHCNSVSVNARTSHTNLLPEGGVEARQVRLPVHAIVALLNVACNQRFRAACLSIGVLRVWMLDASFRCEHCRYSGRQRKRGHGARVRKRAIALDRNALDQPMHQQYSQRCKQLSIVRAALV